MKGFIVKKSRLKNTIKGKNVNANEIKAIDIKRNIFLNAISLLIRPDKK